MASIVLYAHGAILIALLFICLFTIDQANTPAESFWNVFVSWNLWRYLITVVIGMVGIWLNSQLNRTTPNHWLRSHTFISILVLGWFLYVFFWELCFIYSDISQLFEWSCWQYGWCTSPAIGAMATVSGCPTALTQLMCRVDEYCIDYSGASKCVSRNVRNEWWCLFAFLGGYIILEIYFLLEAAKIVKEDGIDEKKKEAMETESRFPYPVVYQTVASRRGGAPIHSSFTPDLRLGITDIEEDDL